MADGLGLLGCVISLAGVVAGLFWQANLSAVKWGGYAQLVALVLIVAAAIRGRARWLICLPLFAAGGYLWLLEQGH